MSNITTSDGNVFLTTISDFINKLFKRKMTSIVQVATAVVISLDIDDIPTVRLLSSPNDGSEDFVVENNSGQSLVENDTVRLFYWDTLTNAYIARKG